MDHEFEAIGHQSFVPGLIVAFEGAMAIVLVGVEQERWDFPREILPTAAEPGSLLLIELLDGRPTRVEIDADAEAVQPRPVDDRLARLDRYERLTGHEVVAGR